MIKQYFQATNNITCIDRRKLSLSSTGFAVSEGQKRESNKFYFLEIYKKEVLIKIINHCINYPLLGEKLKSLKKIELSLK